MNRESKNLIFLTLVFLAIIAFAGSREEFAFETAAAAGEEKAGKSPWGADDEIGALNMMTSESRFSILSRISGGNVYDLAVEYFVGMPSFSMLGDPAYQQWMTHTPQGVIVANPLKAARG